MKHSFYSGIAALSILSFLGAGQSLPSALTRDGAESALVAGKPDITVQLTEKKIIVDGALDDEAWGDAAAYEGYFFQLQPLDRAPSSEKTRVMVLQDARMIYFGIQCYDRNHIKSTLPPCAGT